MLFGPMQVLVYGCPLPRMRSRKGMWLLALLTLRHGRPVQREWLAEALWPDIDQPLAFANMRPILSELRQGLGDQSKRLQSPSRHTLLLDLGGADLDIQVFDAAIKSGTRADLEQAAALYRGSLLEGCDEEWALQERNVRERQCLDALMTLGSAAMASNDYEKAANFFGRAATLDPWWDAAQRGWMEALAENGDRNAALRVYREFASLLKEDANNTPDEETIDLYNRLQSKGRRSTPPTETQDTVMEEAASATRRVTGYLPHALTDLVGREDERMEVAAILQKSRMVTLVGPGGIGKTRLALAVAAEVAPDYSGGVWLVALDTISNGEQIPAQIAKGLGVKEESGRTVLQSVIDRLHADQLLLVLDNCEHVLEASAQAAEQILQACARLRILATSREALGIDGEAEWIVPGLSVATPEQLPSGRTTLVRVLAEYASVQLFVERARSVNKMFSLTGDNARQIAEICYRLGGLPLAIELAAARLKALTVTQIAVRLDNHLNLLTGGSRGAPSRQQTLRATLDWSYSLLSRPEQIMLERLSVFAGGWTLEAAGAVCSDNGIPANQVADLLASLKDKSLLVFHESEAGWRYRFLEMVRQYAAEQVSEPMATVRDRHLAWAVAVAAEVDTLQNSERADWLRKMDTERDNMRVALDWSASSTERAEIDLKLTNKLWLYWYLRGEYAEARRFTQAALERAGDHVSPLMRSHALHGVGTMAAFECDYAAASRFCEESLTLRREFGNISDVASSLTSLGNIADGQGNSAQARAFYEESLNIYRSLGDRSDIAMLLSNLAGAIYRQDMARAQSLYEESLAIYRELEDVKGIVMALSNVGLMAFEQHDYPAVFAPITESLELARNGGDKSGTARALMTLGETALQLGDRVAAQSYLEESLSLYNDTGERIYSAWAIMCLGHVARDRKDFAAARDLYNQCLHHFREIGNPISEGWSLYFLGRTVNDLGNPAQARTLLREGACIFHEADDLSGLAMSILGMATIEFDQGNIQQAARIWGAARAIYEDDDTFMSPKEREKFEAQISEARSILGDGVFASAFDEGRELSWEQAAAYTPNHSQP